MLRVAVIELRAHWGHPGLALHGLGEVLPSLDADLVVLPEASLTGYVSPRGEFDLAPFAEDIDGPTATRCGELARLGQTHLVAPLVLKEAAGIFNACVCYSPTGERLFIYKKRHPWIPETWATAGPEPLPLVTIGGLTVSIAICFDVHFLEEESAAQLEQADLLLLPSAWVDDTPEPTRRPLLQHLATRFNLNVANANWGRGDVTLNGQGGSCLLNRTGKVLAEVEPGQQVAIAELV